MRLLLVIPCSLVVLFAACGGGGGSGSQATATPKAAAASATPSDASSGTPQAGGTATPAKDPFADLQSYRYQMELSGDGSTTVIIKGAVKAPDSISLDFYVSDSNTPINSMIIIGNQAWAKSSTDGEWQSVAIADAEGEVSGLLPKDFWGGFPVDKVVAVSSDKGEETVNGIKTEHYQISQPDADTMAKLAEIFGGADPENQPDKFSMDLWRADDGGWPAKATMSATYPEGASVSEASVSWEVSDVNSSDISVQPPA